MTKKEFEEELGRLVDLNSFFRSKVVKHNKEMRKCRKNDCHASGYHSEQKSRMIEAKNKINKIINILENYTEIEKQEFDKDMPVNEIADNFSCRKSKIRDKMKKFGNENRKIKRSKVIYRKIDNEKYIVRLQQCGRRDDAIFMGGVFKIIDGESHYQFTIMSCRDTITQKIKRRLN